MITLDEYIKKLDKIEEPDFKFLAEKLKLYLEEQKFYNIDLNTRQVEAPAFISAKGDHEAQVICFTVDRFFENMDLAQDVVCVIQYINATGEPYLYRVPFYDTYLLKEEGKMVLPWIIKAPATNHSGKIQFAFQFYKLDKAEIKTYEPIILSKDTYTPGIYYYEEEEGTGKYKLDEGDFNPNRPYYEYIYKVKGYLFNLHTLPAYSQVLHTLSINNIPQLEYEYILIKNITKDNFISGILYTEIGKDNYILADEYIDGEKYYIKNEFSSSDRIHEIYADLTTLKNQLDEWDIFWEEI